MMASGTYVWNTWLLQYSQVESLYPQRTTTPIEKGISKQSTKTILRLQKLWALSTFKQEDLQNVEAALNRDKRHMVTKKGKD